VTQNITKPITWILLADGKHARILCHETIGKALEIRASFNHEALPTRQLGSDRPGRVFESTGAMHHSMDNTDWHQEEEENFIHHVAVTINDHALQQHFDRLILIAPPHTLGVLRKQLNAHSTAKIIGEVPRNLLHADSRSLKEHLDKIMVV
jgi:protein required for attachment to host cells